MAGWTCAFGACTSFFQLSSIHSLECTLIRLLVRLDLVLDFTHTQNTQLAHTHKTLENKKRTQQKKSTEIHSWQTHSNLFTQINTFSAENGFTRRLKETHYLIIRVCEGWSVPQTNLCVPHFILFLISFFSLSLGRFLERIINGGAVRCGN